MSIIITESSYMFSKSSTKEIAAAMVLTTNVDSISFRTSLSWAKLCSFLILLNLSKTEILHFRIFVP